MNTGIYRNEKFGEVRIVMIDEEPWFVGKDVAVALGYTNQTKAIRDHVDMDDKIVGVQNVTPSIIDAIGREQFPKGHVWNVYQKYAALGLTHTKTEPISGGEKIQSVSRTRWTPRGRIFIYELLKEEGILPLCERSDQVTIYDRS